MTAKDRSRCAVLAGCEITVSSRAEQEGEWRAYRKGVVAAARKAAKATAKVSLSHD